MIIATVIAGVTSAPNGMTLRTTALLSVAAGAFVATEIVTRRQLENRKRNERRRRKAAERKAIVGLAFQQEEDEHLYLNPISSLGADAEHGSAQSELVTESEEEAVLEVDEQAAVQAVALEEINVWANIEAEVQRQVVHPEAWDHPEPDTVPETAEHDDVVAVDVNIEREDDVIVADVDVNVRDEFVRDLEAGVMAVDVEARGDHLAQLENTKLHGEVPINAGVLANVEVDFSGSVEVECNDHVNEFDVEARDDRQAHLEEAGNDGDFAVDVKVEREEAGAMAVAEVDVKSEHLGRSLRLTLSSILRETLRPTLRPPVFEDTVEDSVEGNLEGDVKSEFAEDNKANLLGSVEGNLELGIEGDGEEPKVEPITCPEDVECNDNMKVTDIKGDVDCEKVKESSTSEEGIEEDMPVLKGEVICGLNVDVSNDESRDVEDWSEVEEETYSKQKVVEIPKWVSAFEDEKIEEKGSDNYTLERPEEWSDVEEEDGKEDDGEREDADNCIEDKEFNDSADGECWDSRKGHNRAGSLKDSKAPSNETIDQSTSKTCGPVISNPVITAKRSQGTIARFVSYGLAGFSVVLGVMACMDAWRSAIPMPVSTTMCPTLATELGILLLRIEP
ncbi:hypothetical protein BC829DRAFT_400888 [Chytridium lagenaria]|nr:hypothetical protein BC829DRAFT_400888 [Chytridium lagenaria]